MPVRAALDFNDYAAANAWSKANGHGGIVKQAWNLRPRLLDLERAVLANADAAIFEAHPELQFARLSRRPLESKKTPEGHRQRLSLLHRAGIAELAKVLNETPKSAASPDDILDAAVLLITAKRISMGEASSYPQSPVVNGQGITMRIWV